MVNLTFVIIYYFMAAIVAAINHEQLEEMMETDAAFVTVSFLVAWPAYLLLFMAEPPQHLKD